MAPDLRNQVAIIGAAETDSVGRIPEITQLGLHAQAARNAIRDAGIDKSQIDGLACAGESVVAVADYLDIQPSYVDGTSIGGSSFMIHVAHAVAALTAGYCQYVLITHGESGRSRVGRGGFGGGAATLPGQFEAPYGTLGPPNTFTVPVVAHMQKYGTTEEQIASVSVATRAWAALNPRAMMRDPITVDDVLNSRLIAWPIHLLECCLVTDGGGALILTTADRARDFAKPPVYVLGTGEGAENLMISTMHDFTEARSFQRSVERAFRLAGIERSDVDHLMLYDAFAHTPMYGLEALGFVKPGESGPFFAEGRSAPGGDLPINTNGGGLSYTHTGMYGMFALQESVRQLRGEAAAQIPDVKVSIAHGPAGFFAGAGTVIMTNQPSTGGAGMAEQQSIITQEMRDQIGKEGPPSTLEVDKTAVRMFARAVGHTDPVFYDEDEAKQRGYRSLPAPPGYLGTRVFNPKGGEAEGPGGFTRGPYKRILNGGTEIEYLGDICAGDTLTARSKIASLSERQGNIGPMLITVSETGYTNQVGKLVAVSRGTIISY